MIFLEIDLKANGVDWLGAFKMRACDADSFQHIIEARTIANVCTRATKTDCSIEWACAQETHGCSVTLGTSVIGLSVLYYDILATLSIIESCHVAYKQQHRNLVVCSTSTEHYIFVAHPGPQGGLYHREDSELQGRQYTSEGLPGGKKSTRKLKTNCPEGDNQFS